jgi:hypothetical protein
MSTMSMDLCRNPPQNERFQEQMNRRREEESIKARIGPRTGQSLEMISTCEGATNPVHERFRVETRT